MQQQHNEGVGYNGHTVIQPLSHSFKVGKPPNSLFLDTMDFLTMEVALLCSYQWGTGDLKRVRGSEIFCNELGGSNFLFCASCHCE